MASEETWGGVVIKGEGPKGMGGGGCLQLWLVINF